MQKLPTYTTTVPNEAETEEYDQEIRKFHIDNSLPEIEDTRIIIGGEKMKLFRNILTSQNWYKLYLAAFMVLRWNHLSMS